MKPEVDIAEIAYLDIGSVKKPKVNLHELHDEGYVQAFHVQVVGDIPVFGPPGWTKSETWKLQVIIADL